MTTVPYPHPAFDGTVGTQTLCWIRHGRHHGQSVFLSALSKRVLQALVSLHLTERVDIGIEPFVMSHDEMMQASCHVA